MPVDKPNIQDDSLELDAVFALRPPQEASREIKEDQSAVRGSHFASATPVASVAAAKAAIPAKDSSSPQKATPAEHLAAVVDVSAVKLPATEAKNPLGSEVSAAPESAATGSKPAKASLHKGLANLPSFDDEEDSLTPLGAPASPQVPGTSPAVSPKALGNPEPAAGEKKPSVLDATGPGPRALNVPLAEKAAAAKVEARSSHMASGGASKGASKASSKRKAQIKKYSRYNHRYLDREQLKASAEPATGTAVAPAAGSGFALVSDDGLAFSWLPFMIYGGAGALVCIAWCVLARVLATPPLIPGDALLTAGLILLCVIVVAGLVLAGIAAKLTLDEGDAETFDVFSSVVSKTAIAMVAAIVVWVICMAVATML